jgi:hypothetical protein
MTVRWGDISYDTESRKCCYWEGDGKDGAQRVCLTCDENWRNCKESFGARRSKLSTSPPSLEEAPNMDDSGLGTKLWGGNLGNEFRIEGGTE